MKRSLASRAEAPADRVTFRDLDQHIQARLQLRTACTVDKERATIIGFFRWAVARGYLDTTPAVSLPAIKGAVELPVFRTVAEIEVMLERGGLAQAGGTDLWNCLYLNPPEIAGLLRSVRERADADYDYLLHAIPAYTGMRRGELLRLRWEDIEF